MKQWQICQPKNRQEKLIWRNTWQEGEETMSSEISKQSSASKKIRKYWKNKRISTNAKNRILIILENWIGRYFPKVKRVTLSMYEMWTNMHRIERDPSCLGWTHVTMTCFNQQLQDQVIQQLMKHMNLNVNILHKRCTQWQKSFKLFTITLSVVLNIWTDVLAVINRSSVRKCEANKYPKCFETLLEACITAIAIIDDTKLICSTYQSNQSNGSNQSVLKQEKWDFLWNHNV